MRSQATAVRRIVLFRPLQVRANFTRPLPNTCPTSCAPAEPSLGRTRADSIGREPWITTVADVAAALGIELPKAPSATFFSSSPSPPTIGEAALVAIIILDVLDT
jgi:hypothetical protein